MIRHRDPFAATADSSPNINSTALAAIAALWLIVYVPLTWSTQRDTFSWLRGQPLALHPTLVVLASAALWTSPVMALAGTLRLLRRQNSVGRARVVLAYLQTLTVVLVVVVEAAVAGPLLGDGATPSLSRERWLGLTLVASSAAICAGTSQLARIAHASPHFTCRHRPCDVRSARRCSLAAGICALFAAPLTYVSRTSTPNAGAVLLYGGATVSWLFAAGPPRVLREAQNTSDQASEGRRGSP